MCLESLLKGSCSSSMAVWHTSAQIFSGCLSLHLFWEHYCLIVWHIWFSTRLEANWCFAAITNAGNLETALFSIIVLEDSRKYWYT
jgi:hypothetical protein